RDRHSVPTRRSSDLALARSAGKTPLSSTRASTPSAEVFIHSAKRTASAWWSLPTTTDVAEPPQLPVAFAPGSHCGMVDIRQDPAVLPALPSSTPGAQAADTQPIWVPSFRAAFHCGVYIGSVEMTPSSTSPPQNSATRRVGSASISTFQRSPSISHHEAPACCARPTNRPGSVEEKVPRYIEGSASWTTRAADRKSVA